MIRNFAVLTLLWVLSPATTPAMYADTNATNQTVVQPLSVQGVVWSRFVRPAGTDVTNTYSFRIDVKGSQWITRYKQQSTNDFRDYEEASFDGKNLYYLCNFATAIAEARKTGFKENNIASGWADRAEVFHSVPTDPMGIVWLAFASSSYFASRNSELGGFPLCYGQITARHNRSRNRAALFFPAWVGNPNPRAPRVNIFRFSVRSRFRFESPACVSRDMETVCT